MEQFTNIDLWNLVTAILTSLGGGAIIIGFLFKWLGEVTAKKILQREQGDILRSIEELRQKLGVLQSNYEKNADWLLEFYSMFYRHYQFSHRAARADIIQHTDREDEDTKAKYLDHIDDLAEEWNNSQALARILLPSNMLELHEKAIHKFNAFKDAVKKFDKSNPDSRAAVENCFEEVHVVKEEMERRIRSYLRSEELAH